MNRLTKKAGMAFPGDLEDHLKKAHAAIHGREMWDDRYSDVCDLIKRARKLLHDIEKTAEVSQQGEGAPQVMGKADPVDKAGWQPKEGRFSPSPADPKRGELPKRPSAAERHAGRAPGSTAKPPKGWGSSRFNPKNKALRKAVTSAARQAGR